MNLKNNFVLIGLIAFISITIFFYKSLGKDVDTSQVSKTPEASPTGSSNQVIASEYNNGTYTSTGAYISPGGPEEIEVTLNIENDIVQSSEIVKKAELPTSIFFQEKFESAYKEYVVGKNINDIKVDTIAGSSLTPIGFNDAVGKIKAQAKS